MQAVLDTNVVVSALRWNGPPYRLLQHATDGDLELFTSPTLAAELEEILGRRHLAKKLQEQRTSARQLTSLYLELAHSVSPLTTPRIVRDPDDDHVLACAVAATVDLVVTGDQDLLIIKHYQHIPIITPVEALRMIEAGTVQK
jgi:uncharacterized protein